MRPCLRARVSRIVVALGLAVGIALPAARPTGAADSLVLRLGQLQDLDSLNPYQSALVVSYEAYLLSYNLLVDFGPDLEPYPGFAESWERAADGHSWTFKIRPGMKWSDGQPATSEDACFSFQTNLDANTAGEAIGLGYIDPGLSDAAVTRVDCPDPETMVITTDDPSTRILQTYIPILPKHIWGKETYKTIGQATFEPPLVGTGPYQAIEWKTGEYLRLVRNPNYWGTRGAADQVVIQFFKSADTMVQALKAGDIDYARGLNPDQINQLKSEPNVTTVIGTSNGWTELGFNTYGTGTGKTIKGGGPSTRALQDATFRDAIGYAIDKQTLLERIAGGYGTLGTTQVPPVLGQWHAEPTTLRTFDIALAKQKLDAAGYLLDGSGRRLDKDGKPIELRLVMPDTEDAFSKIAQFVQDWFGQLGIKVTPKVYDEATLVDLMLPPEAGGAANKADYDLFIWTWSGSPDPNTLLQIFKCDAIGSSSDSLYCNPHYDELYDQQNKAATSEARKTLLAEMQQIFYDDAPYHILYYDSELHAYRTDRFGGWQKQPTANGTPLFSYGTIDYTFLTDASAAPTPTPAASGQPAASASPATGTGGGTSTGSDGTLLFVAIVLVAAVVAVGLVVANRRQGGPSEEE